MMASYSSEKSVRKNCPCTVSRAAVRVQMRSPLPYTVEFEGKTLEIAPYFDNVLDVLSVFDDADRTEEEKVEVKRQIEVFKQYYDLISDGSYFRLTSPQDNNCVVWEMAARDASKALISAVYQHVQTNCAAKFVYPRGLCSDASYEVSLTDLKGDKKDRMQKQVLTGAALMRGGLRLPGADSDYAAWQISLKKL